MAWPRALDSGGILPPARYWCSGYRDSSDRGRGAPGRDSATRSDPNRCRPGHVALPHGNYRPFCPGLEGSNSAGSRPCFAPSFAREMHLRALRCRHEPFPDRCLGLPGSFPGTFCRCRVQSCRHAASQHAGQAGCEIDAPTPSRPVLKIRSRFNWIRKSRSGGSPFDQRFRLGALRGVFTLAGFSSSLDEPLLPPPSFFEMPSVRWTSNVSPDSTF